MRILIVSFYFTPDIGPARPLRASSLVKALQENNKVTSIDIITSMPNRYKSFKIEAENINIDGITTVKRLSLPSHKSDLWGQSREHS